MQILWISYISSWTPTLVDLIKRENRLAIIVPTGGKVVNYEQIDDVDYYYLHLHPQDTMKRMNRNNFEHYHYNQSKSRYYSCTWYRTEFCSSPKLYLHTCCYIYPRDITSLQTFYQQLFTRSNNKTFSYH